MSAAPKANHNHTSDIQGFIRNGIGEVIAETAYKKATANNIFSTDTIAKTTSNEHGNHGSKRGELTTHPVCASFRSN